jgi:SGNH hydrolase-like domain, acetyltransferase AlgX
MEKAKKTLFLFVLVLLILPAFQHATGLIKIKPLKGSFHAKKIPDFNWENYLNNDFQDKFNKALEDNIGLRPLFIRINNQLAYSLFDTALANSVIIGKKNYLFERNYIKAYLGKDFIGRDSIETKVKKLHFIQQKLAEDSIHLFVVLAPGKASFFPEYIPDEFNPTERGISNYDCFKTCFDKQGINYIDFNEYFVNIKDTCSYPLYPQFGIHWSAYGANLAFDSLISYMDSRTTKNMIGVDWREIRTSSRPDVTDYDIAGGMNLLFRLPTYPMAYPMLNFDDKGKFKPNVVTVADSYYWNIFGKGLSSMAFSNNSFWYYFKICHNPAYEKGRRPLEEIDIKKELKAQDFVILLSTDANLHKFPFGFIEEVYPMVQSTDR